MSLSNIKQIFSHLFIGKIPMIHAEKTKLQDRMCNIMHKQEGIRNTKYWVWHYQLHDRHVITHTNGYVRVASRNHRFANIKDIIGGGGGGGAGGLEVGVTITKQMQWVTSREGSEEKESDTPNPSTNCPQPSMPWVPGCQFYIHFVFRNGEKSCGAILGHGESSSVYPPMTTPV